MFKLQNDLEKLRISKNILLWSSIGLEVAGSILGVLVAYVFIDGQSISSGLLSIVKSIPIILLILGFLLLLQHSNYRYRYIQLKYSKRRC